MKIWSTATLTVLVRSRSRLAVSFTGISSGSATIATPVFRWLVMNRLSVSACVAIGPTRATFANVFGRLEEADSVAGRGSVEDHEVVRLARLDLALVERELPHLADGHQLAKARAWRPPGR